MKHFLTLILTLFFTLILSPSVFSKKTYQFEATVYSMQSFLPLKDIKVRCISKKDTTKVNEKVTNEKGIVLFEGLTEKDYTFLAIDPNGTYQKIEIPFYNSKREDESQKVYLCFTPALEKAMIEEKTKHIKYDSTDFIKCNRENLMEAQFPNGYKDLMSRFVYNIRYPQSALDKGINGKVYASFIIEKDGSMSNLTVVRGIDPEIDAEAIRIISYLPNWEPAKCNGEPIRTKYYLPVLFSLE